MQTQTSPAIVRALSKLRDIPAPHISMIPLEPLSKMASVKLTEKDCIKYGFVTDGHYILKSSAVQNWRGLQYLREGSSSVPESTIKQVWEGMTSKTYLRCEHYFQFDGTKKMSWLVCLHRAWSAVGTVTQAKLDYRTDALCLLDGRAVRRVWHMLGKPDDLSFRARDESTAAALYVGNKLVGFLMPVRR